MPGPFPNGQLAFAELKRVCHKNISSTHKTMKKLGWQMAKMAFSAATLGISDLAKQGGQLVKEFVSFIVPKLPDLIEKGGELIPNASGPVDRSKIPSILQRGSTLSLIAPERSGTEGFVKAEDLVQSMRDHLKKAKEAQGEIPVGVQLQILSCCHAEELYQHFVNMDYHMSKVKAYALALQNLSKSYLDFCTEFEKSWSNQWNEMLKSVEWTLSKPLNWHMENCGADEDLRQHCYRAKFVVAPPPPLQHAALPVQHAGQVQGGNPLPVNPHAVQPQGPLVRRPGPPAPQGQVVFRPPPPRRGR
ncbi:MAG TPA: hypothetical protein VMG30_17960 [Acidobacteriota bacterium]|nr:hypothetical protein [Acidobacteriota bacterium]